MAEFITMPALGESVTEGTVSMWLKEVGDTVDADEPLVEVATDKVDTEVPSPVAGVLLEILVEEDETVEVGTPIAKVGASDEAAAPAEPEESGPVVPPAPPSFPPSAGAPGAPAASEAQPVTSAAPVIPPAPPSFPPAHRVDDEPSAAPAPAAPAPAAPAPAAPAAPAPTADGGDTGDSTEITMPALGESVTEGTVSMWLKEVGDTVDADEPLVEVATDKVDTEVPSPVAGVLLEILVEEDETVEVGTPIARVGSPTSGASAPAQPAAQPAVEEATPQPPAAPLVPPVAPETAAPETAAPAPAAPAATASAPATPAAGTYVTPIVRKLARENGVDLSEVTGSGVGGRIRKEDVLAVVEAKASTPAAPAVAASTDTASAISEEAAALRGTTQKMTRLRQTIAKHMMESLESSAQLTTVFEADVTKVAEIRAAYKDEFEKVHGTRLTFLPFFVKAAIDSLKEHPVMNASISGNEVIYHDHENIGIAVDAPEGLMVPVIKDAGEMQLPQIAESINSLATDVRDGTVKVDQLTGSTFTITNTGSGGALFDTPVLNMPEVGIMGVGTIVKRPVVIKNQLGGDSIAIRSMVYLSISYDHRLVDGADAARFLSSVKQKLEAADFLPSLQL